MAGPTSTAVVLHSSANSDNHQPVMFSLHHSLTPPISRISISWSTGNTLRVSLLLPPQNDSSAVGGEVVELKLNELTSESRKLAYGSASPFALLQSRKNAISTLSKMSPHEFDWSEYVMEYSKEINDILGDSNSQPRSLIEDPKMVMMKSKEANCMKAAWELMQIFYADKQSQAWLPEKLVDWLADYDSLLSEKEVTIHSKLVEFQKELVSLQAVEDDPRYWEMLSSALAVGWLETVVKLLRLHGSYQPDQLSNRETENGLVEAVASLILQMPRMCPTLEVGKLGESYTSKPDFMKAWEKWRAKISKLDCSAYWIQCGHDQTKGGLKSMLQIMLGEVNNLGSATFHWIELYISHFLYIRPFTMGMENTYSLAQKCFQLKPVSSPCRLVKLLVGILEENTEVVLAECSREFSPWMVAHAMELLAAGSGEAEVTLREERFNLGGISIEELYRLIYAHALSSHVLTWQIAPIYLMSCMKQGMGLLEILLYRLPVQQNKTLLKILEICRLYELNNVSEKMMKIAGIYHWKHGRKGAAVFWLQQAHDEVRLNRIAQTLFDFVGRSINDESFKQWEGLIELLASESKNAGGLEFLHKYRDFKKSLKQVYDGKYADASQQAVDSLISIMKNPSTPQQFLLPILYDSLKLLNWRERPLLNVSQTNLLLNKLQELSIAKLRPDFIEANLSPEALSSVRLALGTNLGRAILEE